MPAREKTSATFLAAAVVGRGAGGEAEFGGYAVGCSAGPRYKPVRGELMRRSSRFVNHTASAAQTTSPPGTDRTAMDFRRLFSAIPWPSRPAPGSASIHRLGHQSDILLARRFALGVLPDPGFPTPSVCHVAAREGKPHHVGVVDRLLVAALGQAAHRPPGGIAIEDVALHADAGIEGN